MKILWWIDHLGCGGSQKVFTRLIEYFALTGAEQSVISLNHVVNPQLLTRIESTGADVLIVGKTRIKTGIGLITVVNWLWNRRYDSSITFLFGSDIVGTIFAWLMGIPQRVSAQRSSNRHYSWFRQKILKIALRYSTDIVINNNSYQERSYLYVPKNRKVMGISNGIDVRRYRSVGRDKSLRLELGLSPDCYLIGSVGRLSWEKGFEIIVRAFRLLDDPLTHLVFAGEGPQRTKLLELAANLGVGDRVHLLGERADVETVFHGLQIYVQASAFEGMSNSLMEAMASSCPAIVTAVDGNSELIQDGEHGWLVEPNNVEQLANTIKVVMQNPIEVSRRVKLARSRLENHFSEEAMLSDWRNLLNGKLIDGKKLR